MKSPNGGMTSDISPLGTRRSDLSMLFSRNDVVREVSEESQESIKNPCQEDSEDLASGTSQELKQVVKKSLSNASSFNIYEPHSSSSQDVVSEVSSCVESHQIEEAKNISMNTTDDLKLNETLQNSKNNLTAIADDQQQQQQQSLWSYIGGWFGYTAEEQTPAPDQTPDPAETPQAQQQTGSSFISDD